MYKYIHCNPIHNGTKLETAGKHSPPDCYTFNQKVDFRNYTSAFDIIFSEEKNDYIFVWFLRALWLF